MSNLVTKAIVGAFTALAFAVNPSAQSGPGLPYFQTTTFGMVGVGTDQAVRLNVLNPGSPAIAGKPTCAVEMSFLDSAGRILKSSAAMPVDDDKAVSLDIDRRDVADPALRIEVRAIVKLAAIPPGPIMPGSVCSLIPTLEVFDRTTGRTTIILSEGRTMVLSTPAGSALPRVPR